MNLTEKELERLKNMTVIELAQRLEEGLDHMCILDEKMSVLEFIKHYLDE